MAKPRFKTAIDRKDAEKVILRDDTAILDEPSNFRDRPAPLSRYSVKSANERYSSEDREDLAATPVSGDDIAKMGNKQLTHNGHNSSSYGTKETHKVIEDKHLITPANRANDTSRRPGL